MLFRLVLVIFIVEIQTVASEKLVPSPEVLANALQQAEKFRDQTNQLMTRHIFPSLEVQSTNRGCLAQRLDNAKPKGCLQKLPTSQKKSGEIIVFVSFSMPEASLKLLSQAAHKHNAVLVLRGLYQDSFVKTAQKLQELEVTIDINPELFEKHQITAVPTFVFLKEGQPVCVLKGNVTLEFVSTKFSKYEVKEFRVEEVPCVSLTP